MTKFRTSQSRLDTVIYALSRAPTQTRASTTDNAIGRYNVDILVWTTIMEESVQIWLSSWKLSLHVSSHDHDLIGMNGTLSADIGANIRGPSKMLRV